MNRIAIAVVLGIIVFVAAPVAATEEQAAQETPARVSDVITVTASRFEQPLSEAPAAMTVLTAADLATIPADDYGDLLRTVPGLNVAQMSARDVEINGRQATSAVATSELVLLDGRTIYLDFFGFVMWDFLPVDLEELRQIEVVRGPGSAVWGANAMSGVINLITKPPREMVGTSIRLGAGEQDTLSAGLTHAEARDRLSWKVGAAYYRQDPYDRPTGLVPGTDTPYPPFRNEGTEQPKLNFRLDFDGAGDSLWSFAAGYAGTGGILHTGMGPFNIPRGSALGFAQADWQRRALRVRLFANILDGDGESLLARGVDGRPISFVVESETYDLEVADSTAPGKRHLLSYGVNARTTDFNMTIAPDGKRRDEWGLYLQDELSLGERWRWLVGARWDDIDPIGAVVSPRTSLLFAPSSDHTLRLSFSRAFRAPSLLNNFMRTAIVTQVTLPPFPPFLPAPLPIFFPTRSVGAPNLDEESLTALEAGYVASLGRGGSFSLAVYRNETDDYIDFYPATFYNSSNPVPGWPLPPQLLDFPPLAGLFPESLSFRNVGEIVDRGAEAAFSWRAASGWSMFVNYSYQDRPQAVGISNEEINRPPRHRANLGGAWDSGRFFAHGDVNFVDDAFWTDVLDARFWGPTDDYVQVNLAAGFRLAGDRATIKASALNLFDERVQQHVFGDVIGRKVNVDLRFAW